MRCKLVFVAVAVAGLVATGCGQVTGESERGSVPKSTPTTASPTPKSDKPTQPDMVPIDETALVGDLQVKVTEVERRKYVGPGRFQKTADGIFVVVDVKATNMGNKPASLDYSSIKVAKLQDGKVYSISSAGDVLPSNEDNAGGLATSLNVGTTEAGTLVFDVPQQVDVDALKLSTVKSDEVVYFGLP